MSDKVVILLPEQEEHIVLLGEDSDHEDEREGDQTESTRWERGRGSDQNEQTGSGEQGRGDQEDGESDGEEEESNQEDESELNSEEFSCSGFSPCDQGDEALKMALLNVHSMNKAEKRSKIKELITENNLDVFLPTETWLKKDTADSVLREASPPNFSFYHQAREGQGVAIISQASYSKQHEKKEEKKPPFEYVATVLQHDEWAQPVLLINVFRPLTHSFTQFLEEFEKLLGEVSENDSIIVTGNFNISVSQKTPSTEFQQLLERYNLVKHVEEPTHQNGHTLDLVITRNVEISGLTVQDDIEISDHYAVIFNAKPVTTDAKEKDKDEALKMALLNIWLVNNKPSISEFITENNLDVFLATETGEGDFKEASPPNFIPHHYVRPHRGGGVAIQCSQELRAEQIHFKFRTFEYVAAVLQHDKWAQPVLLINVFRPLKHSFTQFLEEFEKLLGEVSENYNSIIVTGNFNISVSQKTPSIKFQQLLQKNDLVQHVQEPTRQNGRTLDLVITRNVEISGLTVQDDIKISDHYAVIFNAKPVTTDAKEKDEDEALKMALLNVHSMNKAEKRLKIKELITENNLDVFLPTETLLKKDTADSVLREASPPNFNFYHQAREGQGVAIISQASYSKQHEKKEEKKTFEYVATVLQHDEWAQPVLLINVFRPLTHSFTQFLEEFEKLLGEVSENYNSIIVTGNFNIWVYQKTPSIEFQQLLQKNDLVKHVQEPTRQNGHTLDLVITRNVEISGLTVQDDIEISDHYAVIFNAKPVTTDAKEKDKDEALKMALLNIWLVNNKPSTISEFITENNLDVFLATETGEGDLKEASPPNFIPHHYVRPHRGGGVAIQCSQESQAGQIHFKFRTFEYVAAVLQHDKWAQPVLLINVYRPPTDLKNLTQFHRFLDEFQKLLDEVSKDYNSIIVTGDFNIWVDKNKKSSTTKFQQLLGKNHLVQHVKDKTHKGHTLDLVITRDVGISRLFVRDDGISDHYTVYFTAKPMTKDAKEKDKEKDDEEEKANESEL